MNLNLDLKRNQKVKRCGKCGNVLVTENERKNCKCRVCQSNYAKKRYWDRKNGTFKPKIRGIKSKSGAYWAKHDEELRARPFPFKLVDNAVRDSGYLANEHLFIFDRFMEVGSEKNEI
jgi:hypothetical protein